MLLQLSPHPPLAALYAFYREHQRCGELDGDTEGERVVDDLHVRGGHVASR